MSLTYRIRRQLGVSVDLWRTLGVRAAAHHVQTTLRNLIAHYRFSREFHRKKFDSPQVVEILGSRMLLDPERVGIDRELLLHRIREPIATGYFLSRLNDTDVHVDVGANIGYYTLLTARVCKKVYAVEPHPNNFSRLNDNLELNNLKNVESYNVALGSEEGIVELHCSELSNWHSCVPGLSNSSASISVPAFSLDSFFDSRAKPTTLKIDVEGYELEVLKGAQRTLSSVRVLFLELHGSNLSTEETRKIIDLIGEAGLVATKVIQHDWPGIGIEYPPSRVQDIYRGARSTYEVFYERDD